MSPRRGEQDRVLFISRYFPPDGEVGGRRIARFCQGLPKLGIDPIVLTFPKPVSPTEPEIDSVPVVRVGPWPHPLNLWAKLKSRVGVAGNQSAPPVTVVTEPVSFGIKGHLGMALQVPDSVNSWYLPAKREASKLIAEKAVNTVITSGPPWTCHLIGRALKRRFAINWIADFRDPWTAEVMRCNLPPWRQNVGRKMERGCLEIADAVVCTTQQIRSFFYETYPELPREKFHVVPNGYEPTARPSEVIRDSRRLLLHVGNLYGTRRIDTFCEAVQKLISEGQFDPQATRILFLGDSEEEVIQPAREKTPDIFEKKVVEFKPKVGWALAQSTLWGADVHLIFQGRHTMQIPAKFFECLQTGAPILAVAEPGALTTIVEETKSGVCADSRDVNAIAEQLRRLLSAAPSPNGSAHRSFEEYQWTSVTQKLGNVIDALRHNSIPAGAVRS